MARANINSLVFDAVNSDTMTVKRTVKHISKTCMTDERAKRKRGRFSNTSRRNFVEFFLSPNSSSVEMRRNPTSDKCENAISTVARKTKASNMITAMIISNSILC